MKKNSGNALAQYGIIIALVTISLVPVLILFGDTIETSLRNFCTALATQKEFKFNLSPTPKSQVITDVPKPSNPVNPGPTINTPTVPTIKIGSLGGTPDNPVKKCSAGTCVIDFGEFLLQGIPESFSDNVASSGISGGTDALVNLIKQIAYQLEKEGKTTQATEILKFASIGHNIASLERQWETIANSCERKVDCVTAYKTNTVPKPSTFDETYYKYTPMTYDTLGDYVAVGKSSKMYSKGSNQDYTKTHPAYQFVDKYESLMYSNLTQPTKDVLKELYWRIGILSEDVQEGHYYMFNGVYTQNRTDPVTGEFGAGMELPVNPFDIYTNYKPSTTTHLDSGLICASAHGQDTGTKCH